MAAGAVVVGLVSPVGSTTPLPYAGHVSATEARAAISAGAPMEVRIPQLKVSAPVVPIAMVDKTLDPPKDYYEVGWWIASAKPGAGQGQTVITGHTLHTGGASMNALGTLKPGASVEVTTKNGPLTYHVTDRQVLSKKALAGRSQEIFGQHHGAGRLVLITCSNWNGASYDTNTVVFAEPQPA